MTTVNLRLDMSIYRPDAPSSQGGVVATVRRVGEPSDTLPSSVRLTVSIPVGFTTQPAIVELPVGLYQVDAFLPSGDVISQEVEVQGPTEVVLDGEQSPHEWLSYQHLLGNVRSATSYRRQEMPELGRDPWVYRLDPVPPLNTPGNSDAWLLLGRAIQPQSGQIISELSKYTLHAVPSFVDDRVQLFELVSSGSAPAPTMPAPENGRQFLLVETADECTTLISLPFPWKDIYSYEDRVAEVLVHRRGLSTGRPVAVAIRDTLVGTVMGYLSSGAFTTAEDIIRPAREMLLQKIGNPLAAAAGGYVLVASSTEPNAPWHPWLDNLTNWFPWLPDGPIIRGRLLLQLARNDAEFQVALESLKAGFDRGLPYYGLGLQWLVDGLAVFAEDEPIAADMLAIVRPVARRCNLQQPFTVLDLRKP